MARRIWLDGPALARAIGTAQDPNVYLQGHLERWSRDEAAVRCGTTPGNLEMAERDALAARFNVPLDEFSMPVASLSFVTLNFALRIIQNSSLPGARELQVRQAGHLQALAFARP